MQMRQSSGDRTCTYFPDSEIRPERQEQSQQFLVLQQLVGHAIQPTQLAYEFRVG
jgi:hypothetical protein